MIMDIVNIIGEDFKGSAMILDSFVKADSVINNPKYKTILCSVSGGADSDVMLDLCYKVDINKKITYIWFDTGLEYQATKDHLKELEKKYNIEIKTYRPKKPIPAACKKLGQPFISKYASEMISRLQKYNFKFEDEPFDVLYERYPKCRSALRWFTNNNPTGLNIEQNKYLREFLIANPPAFKISSLCCYHAKKSVSKKAVKEFKADLMIMGVRKYEGGIRGIAYKSCFDSKEGTADRYRPLYWYTNEDKVEYEQMYGITNSECYRSYGLSRTGCAGCPFGRNYEFELKVIKQYEPRLYTAVCNIFKDSYEYTEKYRKFRTEMEQRDKEKKKKAV